MAPERRRLRHHILAVVGLVLIIGGCAGNGCSCMPPIPDGFPPEHREPNSMQIRVTEPALRFLEGNLGALVGIFFPDGLDFQIPPSCGGTPEVCCGQNPEQCVLKVDVNHYPNDPPRLVLDPQDPPRNRLAITLRVRAWTSGKLKVSAYGATCDLTVDSRKGSNPSWRLVIPMDFAQDPAAGTTRIDVANAQVLDVQTADLDFSGGILGSCNLLDPLRGTLISQMIGPLEDQLKKTIAEQLCKPCDTVSDCLPFGTACQSGTCMINDGFGNRCLHELGVSGRLDAAYMMSSMSPGIEGNADLYLVLGGYARSNNGGLSLGGLGGAIPAGLESSPCIAMQPPPALPSGGIPESTVFQGNAYQGMPFHMGVGVHKHFLDSAVWAMYEAGFLCLNVGTRTVDLLTSDTFGLLVPSLADLLHEDTSPLILAIRPTYAPYFTLGEGTFTSDGKIIDPVMTITIPELQIDVYAMVAQRFVRVFTLQTDLKLPIGLDLNGDKQLVPVLGNLADAFQNLKVTNSGLLAESPQEIADKFPAVLSVAVPLIAGGLSPIDVPALAGIDLDIKKITSVDNNTLLAIFADLAIAPAMAQARIATTARVLEVKVPPHEAFSAPRLDPTLRPSVTLDLGALAAFPTGDLEWQFRLNDGMWSPFTRNRIHTISDDAFWLQGRHKIEVRVREVGHPTTLDPYPVVVHAIVDTVPPKVSLVDDGGRILAYATDRVSPPEKLSVSYRFAGGAWQPAGPAPAEIPLGSHDALTLEVAVTDEAGNVGVGSGKDIAFHGRSQSDEGCECAVGAGRTGSAPAGGIALLGMVGAVLLLGRRRARSLALAGRAALRWAARSPRSLLTALALLGAGMGGVACSCGSVAGDVDAEGPAPLRPGPVGRWTSIAADGNRVLVAAYDDRFGDLVIAEPGEPGVLRIRPVDGVPSGPVVREPDGYRGGIQAPGEDVGAWTSIALSGGKGYVAYQNRENGALKFASEVADAPWASHVVDPATDGPTGLYASLSFDPDGVPGIAYLAYPVIDPDGAVWSQLRWAQAASASPSSTSDWSIEVIASARVPCAGTCAKNQVCVAANQTCQVKGSGCDDCSGSNKACVEGACVNTVANPTAADLPEGTGLFASAGRMPDGQAVVAFYDRDAGDLILALRRENEEPVDPEAEEPPPSHVWDRVTLVGGPGDDGQWASLVVAGDGTVHVAFQDALGDRLLHVTWSEGEVGEVEVVDDGRRDGDRPHPVGASASLVLDALGRLSVVYQDSATNQLLYARRNEEGEWTRGDVMTGGAGFWAAAAASGAQVWVANMVYDRAVYPPGDLRLTNLP